LFENWLDLFGIIRWLCHFGNDSLEKSGKSPPKRTKDLKKKPFFLKLRLNGIGLQKLECSADAQAVNETNCDFQQIKDYMIINLHSYLTQTQDFVKLRIQQFKETRPNVFQPLGINFEVNVCDVATKLPPIVINTFEFFAPGNTDQLSTLFRPCPYQPGYIGLKNLTIKATHFQSNFFKGRMKDVFKTFNGKGQTIYELSVYTMQV
jgi:hypothetical protein